MMMPPVGKSGPGTIFISSSSEVSGLAISASVASMISPGLCGGMLVAMPTAMPLAPLISRLGKLGRQNQRLFLRSRRSSAEKSTVSLSMSSSSSTADAGQPHLGVAHRRRVIAVDRAEIALPVDQRHPHGEGLRHAHHGVVDRGVAVRVVFAHDVADDAGGFAIGLVGRVAGLVHAEQDAPVHRLQPVARVRQRARHDHAHRVIEVGAAHLLFERDRLHVVRRARGFGVAHSILNPIIRGPLIRGLKIREAVSWAGDRPIPRPWREGQVPRRQCRPVPIKHRGITLDRRGELPLVGSGWALASRAGMRSEAELRWVKDESLWLSVCVAPRVSRALAIRSQYVCRDHA